MKQFTIVLDGIADRPQEKLGGKTPMEAAKTPGLDAIFASAKPGTVRTIKPGLEVGSAVANLSLLGFDPEKTYKGRAVIEAAGAGIPVQPGNLFHHLTADLGVERGERFVEQQDVRPLEQ